MEALRVGFKSGWSVEGMQELSMLKVSWGRPTTCHEDTANKDCKKIHELASASGEPWLASLQGSTSKPPRPKQQRPVKQAMGGGLDLDEFHIGFLGFQ